MKIRFIKLYTLLTDSFWFIPALMALCAVAAALSTIAYDYTHGNKWLSGLIWLWSGSAEGARSVLAVIAGSIMTVVSIVFSLTIITLSQTSSHFGPRVLRNFTTDRGNQLVLGTFIATFIYCLLILRTINSEDEARFVPFLSVNLGVLLALVSMGVLIYFIHHVSQSIQVEQLIAGIGTDFQRLLPAIFPSRTGQENGGPTLPHDGVWSAAFAGPSRADGYVIGIELERLVELACQHQLLIRIEKRPGQFVTKESLLFRVLPAGGVSEGIEKAILASYSLGSKRTPDQDALYSIQQLAEIAAHALSPGINEPFTAMVCIDWLGASLRRVAGVDMPYCGRYDKERNLRLIVEHTKFEEFVHTSFDQIRLYGSGNQTVMRHLITTIGELAPHLKRTEDANALLFYLELVSQDTSRTLQNHEDKMALAQVNGRAREALMDSLH